MLILQTRRNSPLFVTSLNELLMPSRCSHARPLAIQGVQGARGHDK